jgi:tRNA threonylcarbamoyladenosine biosynthesis protein TsaE
MHRVIACVARTAGETGTQQFGVAVGERIRSGTCVTLIGPLGAGKTVLVRGLCRGLGVDEPVISPTFILLESFSGRLPVLHVDLYRLEHERELDEIGVFDALGTDTVVLAEWGDRSAHLHEASEIEIRIEPGTGEERTITVSAAPSLAPRFEDIPW